MPQQENRLAEILIPSGKITAETLNSVMNEGITLPYETCQKLIDQGFISEEDLLKILGKYFSIPYTSLKKHVGKNLFIENISENFMRGSKFVPLELKENTLTIAVSNPFDDSMFDAIKMATGYEVDICLSKAEEIADAISSESSSMDRIIEDYDEGSIDVNEEGDVDHLKDLASEAPVIRLVNLIISRAVELQASDIHFEPFEDSFHIRYRIDGILHDMESPPKNLQAAVISRIKIMSKLNIAERRLPQDGRIKLRVQGKQIDFRISSLPTLFGESVVMRILDSESITFDLDHLGFPKNNLQAFENLIARPHGIILVTGPTGSGKTTTLYSALNKINAPDKKIITVEDPIEYQLHGVNQVQVKSAIGLTFANTLRSILRQDPDIIMIGEIRDAETAEIAIHAALTGHLVFSTLHTNDAAGAITRLMEMGMENYLVSSSLLGILAQRLVRNVCPKCAATYVPDSETIREMEIAPEDIEGLELARGEGCEYCADTGFRGRSGIYEMMMIDDEIRKLIISNTDSKIIKDKARSLGMQTLRESGWNKVKDKKTTVSEVIRVTQVE
jgi:general secretion pathway protein E